MSEKARFTNVEQLARQVDGFNKAIQHAVNREAFWEKRRRCSRLKGALRLCAFLQSVV